LKTLLSIAQRTEQQRIACSAAPRRDLITWAKRRVAGVRNALFRNHGGRAKHRQQPSLAAAPTLGKHRFARCSYDRVTTDGTKEPRISRQHRAEAHRDLRDQLLRWKRTECTVSGYRTGTRLYTPHRSRVIFWNISAMIQRHGQLSAISATLTTGHWSFARMRVRNWARAISARIMNPKFKFQIWRRCDCFLQTPSENRIVFVSKNNKRPTYLHSSGSLQKPWSVLQPTLQIAVTKTKTVGGDLPHWDRTNTGWRRPVVRFQVWGENIFLGDQDFCFYCMF